MLRPFFYKYLAVGGVFLLLGSLNPLEARSAGGRSSEGGRSSDTRSYEQSRMPNYNEYKSSSQAQDYNNYQNYRDNRDNRQFDDRNSQYNRYPQYDYPTYPAYPSAYPYPTSYTYAAPYSYLPPPTPYQAFPDQARQDSIYRANQHPPEW